MKEVVLTVNKLPPTLNELISMARYNKYASARLKRKWHKELEPFVIGLEKLNGEIYAEFVWFVKNSARDPDNTESAQKYIWDALVEFGIIKDDNMKVIKSPMIHHFVVTNFDGFSLYMRDKEAFQNRLKEDLSKPPTNLISGNTYKPRQRGNSPNTRSE